MKVYHFTCAHSIDKIAAEGLLKPHQQPQLDGRPLIWLTDLEGPDRLDLGLTSVSLVCDRMEFRVTVEADVIRWPEYVRRLPRSVRKKARDLTAGAGLPMHWYVSETALVADSLERWS